MKRRRDWLGEKREMETEKSKGGEDRSPRRPEEN
jgi:hypothetical protein